MDDDQELLRLRRENALYREMLDIPDVPVSLKSATCKNMITKPGLEWWWLEQKLRQKRRELAIKNHEVKLLTFENMKYRT